MSSACPLSGLNAKSGHCLARRPAIWPTRSFASDPPTCRMPYHSGGLGSLIGRILRNDGQMHLGSPSCSSRLPHGTSLLHGNSPSYSDSVSPPEHRLGPTGSFSAPPPPRKAASRRRSRVRSKKLDTFTSHVAAEAKLVTSGEGLGTIHHERGTIGIVHTDRTD